MRVYHFNPFNPFGNRQSPFGNGQNPFETMFGGQNADGQADPESPPPQSRPRTPTTTRGKAVRLIGYLVFFATAYYTILPPLNPQSQEFWSFAAIMMIAALALLSTVVKKQPEVNVYGTDGKPIQPKKQFSLRKLLGFVFALGVVFYFGCSLLSSPIFQAKNYASIITESMTTKDVSEYTPTINNVPLLDSDSAERLASRTLGKLVNEVSQFELEKSVQITVGEAPIRVCSLGYDGFIKWILNRGTGIPAYITVDMKTQNTKIERLENGMKYSQSAYFNDYLMRHLRFRHPTAMFAEPKFELDEEGHPYWVVPVLRHRIMMLAGTDVKGVVACDPVTGDTQYYPIGQIPDWMDNIYSASLIIQQYDWYGRYHNGFLNSIFGQKGVVETTDGYNYIPKDNDVYCYTGVTSVVSDASNIGFIFSDMRTRETEYYEIAGAEEYSAMESAQGIVQHLKYVATFPLLLVIEGQPTYTVALKDEAGLVKMYGMVNMTQYQDVATGKTIKECQANYRDLLIEDGLLKAEDAEKTSDKEAVSGVIADLRSAVREGTTYYYLRLEDGEVYYSLNAADDEAAVLLNIGDEVTLEADREGSIRAAKLK